MPFTGTPPDNPVDKAKWLVQKQYNTTGIATPRGQDIFPLEDDDVYIVWFCYVLGGWKALVSTTRMDQRYYEVTHDKEKGETYIDTYLKTHNIAVAD